LSVHNSTDRVHRNLNPYLVKIGITRNRMHNQRNILKGFERGEQKFMTELKVKVRNDMEKIRFEKNANSSKRYFIDQSFTTDQNNSRTSVQQMEPTKEQKIINSHKDLKLDSSLSKAEGIYMHR